MLIIKKIRLEKANIHVMRSTTTEAVTKSYCSIQYDFRNQLRETNERLK